MNIILLSGCSGKRLWPLSNEVRSKQFIKIFKDENGKYESMLQRVYRQIVQIYNNANVTIATSKAQVSAIHNQLGSCTGICVEPCRKDTFPAIILAASYLHDIKKLPDSDIVIVCPVDPYVDSQYFNELQKLEEVSLNNNGNIVLMGIEPSYPSEKYGYIIPGDNKYISKVVTFKEKPDKKTAKKYISGGALWNGGVFAVKLGYLLDKAYELTGFRSYNDIYSKYNSFDKISFDYAVLEKEKNIYVIRFAGEWKDIGTWNTFTEAVHETSIGNATISQDCCNVHVINELDIPILCMGLKDTVVSASPDGILVSDKEQSSYIKPYVDKMDNIIMFAEKSWGSFKVLDVESESMVIKVTLKHGNRMNYHSHENRDEIWNVIKGQGRVIVDGMEQVIMTGDVITIKAGYKHTVIADTELKIIEVQLGKDINVNDKTKFKLEN